MVQDRQTSIALVPINIVRGPNNQKEGGENIYPRWSNPIFSKNNRPQYQEEAQRDQVW